MKTCLSGITHQHFSVRVTPELTLTSLAKRLLYFALSWWPQRWSQSFCFLKGATGEVTTEYLASVSTIKVTDWSSTFILTVGSLGPRRRDPRPLRVYFCQAYVVLLSVFFLVAARFLHLPQLGHLFFPMFLLLAVGTLIIF